jgi:ubiquinone/menaquinone biosynthesis C-methylase UbiE
MQSKVKDTSWESVAAWYDTLVGEKGGYFHTHVIFPKLLPLLSIRPGNKVLDIACGQGAFARILASNDCEVTAVDQSETLISKAKSYDDTNIKYLIDDARTLSQLGKQKFDRITCVLALQNIDPIDGLFKRVHELLVDGGRFVVVLMHPCFRAPRISGWEIDEQRKLMYRRADRYLSPMKVPITAHPGKAQSEVTWAFHRPLSEYVKFARQAHLFVDACDEWVSDKVSVGKHADMENLAREEIPMFLAIRMKRIDHA